ncbi:MAG: hypothetical protein KIT84_43320 [Labilithrix sp.]|nr:hypothetical protein [Labilithrix sp.]MCW5817909.1 hypothetical protein [Labilithrix sp.]
MGAERSAWLLGGGLVVLGLALVAACAEGGEEDLPFGPAADDAGPDVTGAKLPPKKVDDDDDDVVPGDDDDDTGPDGGPKPDGGADAGPTNPTGVSAACAAAIAKASWDFETADTSWTHRPSDGAENQASWPFDPWSRGTASTISCPSGICWAGERTQNYAQCSRGELLSPSIDLSACAAATVTLTFAHAYRFWTGRVGSNDWFDGGIVELSGNGGTAWSAPSATFPGVLKILKGQGGANCVSAPWHTDGKPGFTGSQLTAVDFSIVVPSALITTRTRIRFSTAAGVSTPNVGHHRENTAPGWRIDNVRFTAAP